MTLLNFNHSDFEIEDLSSILTPPSRNKLSVIMESPEKRNEKSQMNEISDEAQHEISMAIHASARQSIRPYNTQVCLCFLFTFLRKSVF